ncbi:MAG: hypothetical protein U0R66_17580 [Mycobacterium sp.]
MAALLPLTVVCGCGVPQPPSPTTTKSSGAVRWSQSELPFSGLGNPDGIAVSNGGDVYVTDSTAARVLKLATGSQVPAEVPVPGLSTVERVAVDTGGNLYVTNIDLEAVENNRVLKLPAESGAPITLPFGVLDGTKGAGPHGLAVDNAGAVYATTSSRVLKLAAGADGPVELPFGAATGPSGIGVDAAGDVFVADLLGADYSSPHVLKLAAGSTTASELPFPGLQGLQDLAVDQAGDVFITVSAKDQDRVLELPAGAAAPVALPFTGLHAPEAVAVDADGRRVYVTTHGDNRVFKLEAT